MGKASYKIRETKNMRHFTYSGNLEDAIEKAERDLQKEKENKEIAQWYWLYEKPKKLLTHITRKLPTLRRLYGVQRKSRKSRKVKRIMKRQTVKKLIQYVAIIAAGVLAIILFMLAIWYRGKNSEPVTDEQVAAQMQQAEPLVIETPEAATEGSIRVYDYDGCCIYAYYGKIRINNDGKDGKDIDVEAIGYLEGYQEHKEESGAGE